MTQDLSLPTFIAEGADSTQKKVNGVNFPLILEPSTTVTKEELLTWATNNQSLLLSLMHKHGALAFRKFPLASPQDFQDLLDAIHLEEYAILSYITGFLMWVAPHQEQ